MTKDEVLWMLGDPKTISDRALAAKPGKDSPLIYRFHSWSRTRRLDGVLFKDGRREQGRPVGRITSSYMTIDHLASLRSMVIYVGRVLVLLALLGISCSTAGRNRTRRQVGIGC